MEVCVKRYDVLVVTLVKHILKQFFPGV